MAPVPAVNDRVRANSTADDRAIGHEGVVTHVSGRSVHVKLDEPVQLFPTFMTDELWFDAADLDNITARERFNAAIMASSAKLWREEV